jgi:basic membrane protein A and related proteins
MTLGAQAVNPKVKTKAIWVNTWYDPGKERQAADALIAQGADNVAQNTDSPASIQAAQEKGTYAFSIDADMSSFGKKAQLLGTTEDWSGYYIAETKKVLDGTWTGNRHMRWGIKEGMVVMAPLNPDIPPAAVKVFEGKKPRLSPVRRTRSPDRSRTIAGRKWLSPVRRCRKPPSSRSIGTLREST